MPRSLTKTWNTGPARTMPPWSLHRKPTYPSAGGPGRCSGRSGWESSPFVAAAPALVGESEVRFRPAEHPRYRVHDPGPHQLAVGFQVLGRHLHVLDGE